MKIISGNIPGVELAALRAAENLGIPTGGWVEPKWKLRKGKKRIITGALPYNLQYAPKYQYDLPVGLNVKDADVVVVIIPILDKNKKIAAVHEFAEMRDRFTHWVPLADYHGKNEFPYWISTPTRELFALFLETHINSTIYITGIDEKSCPGIEYFVRVFLEVTLQRVFNIGATKAAQQVLTEEESWWGADFLNHAEGKPVANRVIPKEESKPVVGFDELKARKEREDCERDQGGHTSQ